MPRKGKDSPGGPEVVLRDKKKRENSYPTRLDGCLHSASAAPPSIWESPPARNEGTRLALSRVPLQWVYNDPLTFRRHHLPCWDGGVGYSGCTKSSGQNGDSTGLSLNDRKQNTCWPFPIAPRDVYGRPRPNREVHFGSIKLHVKFKYPTTLHATTAANDQHSTYWCNR